MTQLIYYLFWVLPLISFFLVLLSLHKLLTKNFTHQVSIGYFSRHEGTKDLSSYRSLSLSLSLSLGSLTQVRPLSCSCIEHGISLPSRFPPGHTITPCQLRPPCVSDTFEVYSVYPQLLTLWILQYHDDRRNEGVTMVN